MLYGPVAFGLSDLIILVTSSGSILSKKRKFRGEFRRVLQSFFISYGCKVLVELIRNTFIGSEYKATLMFRVIFFIYLEYLLPVYFWKVFINFILVKIFSASIDCF